MHRDLLVTFSEGNLALPPGFIFFGLSAGDPARLGMLQDADQRRDQTASAALVLHLAVLISAQRDGSAIGCEDQRSFGKQVVNDGVGGNVFLRMISKLGF